MFYLKKIATYIFIIYKISLKVKKFFKNKELKRVLSFCNVEYKYFFVYLYI